MRRLLLVFAVLLLSTRLVLAQDDTAGVYRLVIPTAQAFADGLDAVWEGEVSPGDGPGKTVERIMFFESAYRDFNAVVEAIFDERYAQGADAALLTQFYNHLNNGTEGNFSRYYSPFLDLTRWNMARVREHLHEQPMNSQWSWRALTRFALAIFH